MSKIRRNIYLDKENDDWLNQNVRNYKRSHFINNLIERAREEMHSEDKKDRRL